MTRAFREISMRLRSASRANKVHTVATPMFQKTASKANILRTIGAHQLRLIINLYKTTMSGWPSRRAGITAHVTTTQRCTARSPLIADPDLDLDPDLESNTPLTDRSFRRRTDFISLDCASVGAEAISKTSSNAAADDCTHRSEQAADSCTFSRADLGCSGTGDRQTARQRRNR